MTTVPSGRGNGAPATTLAWLPASTPWLQASGLGALATVLLLVKWTLLVPDLYESQALVEIERTGAATQAAALGSLLAASQAAEGVAGSYSGHPAQLQALRMDDQHVGFVCRAASAHAAYQSCGELVTRALANKFARGVLRPATLPSKPLGFVHGWEIWLLSCFVGVVSALLWGFGHGLIQSWRRRAQPAAQAHPPRRSSAPSWGGPVGSGPAVRASHEPRSDRPSVVTASAEESLPESLRALRDRLYLLAADSCFIVGVSGKRDDVDARAVVAAQLAWALVTSDEAEVLLVEADFDQPGVHLAMDIAMPSLSGFSQQIHQRLQAGATRPWTVVRSAPLLSVLAEGLVRTPGMMYTAQFSTAFHELRSVYDIVVVSGPAAGTGADVQAFVDVVDAVVYVASPDEDGAAANKAAAQLFRNKRFVTVVAPPRLDET